MEVGPFFVGGNRDKENQFWREMSSWTDGANLVPNSGRSTRTGICRTVFEVIRYIETTAEITGGRRKESWTRSTYAFKPELYIYIKVRQPVKEKILSEGTRQKAKYCNYIFSLSQFKERRKKRKKGRKTFIVTYYPLII